MLLAVEEVEDPAARFELEWTSTTDGWVSELEVAAAVLGASVG